MRNIGDESIALSLLRRMVVRFFHRNAVILIIIIIIIIVVVVIIIVNIVIIIIYIQFKAIWFITIRILQDLFFPSFQYFLLSILPWGVFSIFLTDK
jgi:hypothetical protein